jgi:hypothetical protein
MHLAAGQRGSAWCVSSQSRQASGGASAPVTLPSKASVNWVTIRCCRRWPSGSASLARGQLAARSAVVMATLASGSVM